MSRVPSRENSRSRAASEKPSPRRGNGKVTKADPAEFGKKTSPVRERMAREIKEVSPEERIKQGR